MIELGICILSLWATEIWLSGESQVAEVGVRTISAPKAQQLFLKSFLRGETQATQGTIAPQLGFLKSFLGGGTNRTQDFFQFLWEMEQKGHKQAE